MSDEYLQTESDCNSIANAIRDRNSEPSTTKYKHRDFDDKVDKLPNLIPSLSLSSDKTVSSGSVTLSAELSANEVLTGADEQSVYGKLQNAIIKFYKQGETVPLSSSITNKNGVANTTVTITEDTTFISQFEHKIPYPSATSNTVTVEYEAPHIQYCKYIGSTGTQYINLGYILKAHDKVEVTYSSQSGGHSQYQSVFGARKSNYNNNCFAYFNKFGTSNIAYARTGNEASGSGLTQGTVYSVTAQNGTCTITEEGTVVRTLNSTGTLNDCVNPCGLFCLNTNGGTGFTVDTYGSMNIYSFKITDNDDNVVMDLKPAYYTDTGVIGLYDTVNAVFYENNGTGTFTKGDDI